MTHSITIASPQHGQEAVRTLWAWMRRRLMQGRRVTLSVAEEKRSLPQNKLMWALLSDLSRQVVWHGQKLTKEEWKDMCTAALKRQKVVPGIDGGFVVLGSSTSRMTVAEMTEMIDFIHSFGVQRGVEFSDVSSALEAA